MRGWYYHFLREAYGRAKPPPQRDKVRHYRVVGTERIEITNDFVPEEECQPRDTVSRRMEEVIAVFGTENLK